MKKRVKDFIPQGGAHCITNSLKQVFTYYGYPLSEAMMFGLASGLSFLYLNQAVSPMINGRTKVFEFEETLARRLHIKIGCKAGKNYQKIVDKTKQLIDKDEPILIYVDMPYMSYLGMNENSHFGGHAVVLFGYDDVEKVFYISDRDNHDYAIRVPYGEIAQDFHMVRYDEIEKARTSTHRPFPASNKYLTFDFSKYREIKKETLYEAIKETCESMLNPPAQLLGIHGILKFSKEIKKWKQFTPEKLSLAGTTNYFQISKDGGTGGGIFRKMYGDFLMEASYIAKNDRMLQIGQAFINLSLLWDNVAKNLWELSLHRQSLLLEKMSSDILDIYNIESQLYSQLIEIVT